MPENALPADSLLSERACEEACLVAGSSTGGDPVVSRFAWLNHVEGKEGANPRLSKRFTRPRPRG